MITISPVFLNAKPKKTIRIAVIDSGYTITKYSNVIFCEDGHKDLTKTGLIDNHGHGTHIVNTIVSNLKNNVDYCIILIKWFDPKMSKYYAMHTSRTAFEYLLTQNVDIINYSAGGSGNSIEDRNNIVSLLKKGIKIFVAAGNDGENLNKDCYYYPACYKIKRLEVVANKDLTGKRVSSSNYGKVVTRWEVGVDIVQDTGYNGPRALTGTSQATAIATAKEINRRFK